MADQDLDARVRKVEDIQEITRLINYMCQAMDRNDAAEWVACFTPDGRWTYLAPDRSEPVYDLQGEAQLLEFAKGHDAKNVPFDLKHLIVNEVIDVDGDHATSSAFYFTHVRTATGGFGTRTTGRYEDEFLRSADGRWRIARRIVRLDMGPEPGNRQ